MNSINIAKYVVYSLIIAGVYYVSAIVTKPLILPPTFAAPIWPTAGIGVGVLILWGYRYIPAILLGEILTNLQFYDIKTFVDQPSLILTYGTLLLATVLRSALGTYLVNRHLGKSNNYLTLHSVTKLLVFAGLIPTFISSFVATFALYSKNMFYYDSWTINFFTWWFGDAVGICVIVPLMFLLFKKPRNSWKPRFFKTIIPVVITFVLLIIATHNIKQLEIKRLINILDDKIKVLHDAVELIQNNSLESSQFETSIDSRINRINQIYSTNINEIVLEHDLKNINFQVKFISDIDEIIVFETSDKYSEYQQWKTSKEYSYLQYKWIITAYATSKYYVVQASWLIWWLTSIGFLFIAMLGAGLLVITGSQIIIKDTVIKRTNEIKTLNEILKESESRYKQLVEIQPVIFWKHKIGDNALDFVSNEAINILGYPKNQMLSLDFIWNKLFHPEDRKSALKKYYAGIESQQRFILKYRAIARNGQVVWFKDYISSRHNNGKIIVIGLKIDVTKDQLKEQEITQLAYFDPMTNLPNRVKFMMYLREAMAQSIKQNSFGAVLFLDLDRFKVLNDSMGHFFGDKLLIQIASRLKASLASSDISSRFGGDEFVILLGVQEKSLKLMQEVSLKVAKIIQTVIKEPFNIDGHNFFTTFSTGISLFPANSQDADEIIQQADIAMYASKDLGKNTISFFKKKMQEQAVRRLNFEKSFKIALIKNEFEMYYQPIFDENKRIIKLESLVRWNHPDEGLLTPSSFIQIAEETGFIIELNEWIVDRVFSQMNQWGQSGQLTLPISINISLFQFKNTELIVVLEKALKKYQIDAEKITLELTESIGIDNFKDALKKLNKLKQIGFKLAIDDFGTGYSSLNYLTQMPIDILKLDKSFVVKIGSTQSTDDLIETIVLMAKQLGVELIVEGVETAAQFSFLKNLGCTKFQGFLVSKALSQDEILELLTVGSIS